jgi:cytochrome P450
MVPESGLALSDGRVLPPRTIVGTNPWVIHQSKGGGQDLESFSPERCARNFVNGKSEYEARLTATKQTNLTFGTGNRICLGKNVGIFETYKVIATLFLAYEVSKPLSIVDIELNSHI